MTGEGNGGNPPLARRGVRRTIGVSKTSAARRFLWSAARQRGDHGGRSRRHPCLVDVADLLGTTRGRSRTVVWVSSARDLLDRTSDAQFYPGGRAFDLPRYSHRDWLPLPRERALGG